MLYMGHFSFDERGREKKARHGYFTFVVDSSDVDSAVETFRSQIVNIKAKNGLFDSVAQIYIEDIFEVEKVPQRAVLLRFQSCEGPFPESVSRSLPLGDATGIKALGWAPDIRKIRAADKEETVEMEPFLVFD